MTKIPRAYNNNNNNNIIYLSYLHNYNNIVTWGFMKDHILIDPYVSFEGNHLSPACSVLQFPYPAVSFLLVRSVDLVVIRVRFLSGRNLVVNYGASVNKAEFVCVVDVWLTKSLSWGSGI